MDFRSRIQGGFAVLVLFIGVFGSSVTFGKVSVYGGEFNLPIPDKGWMADAVIEVKDHHIIQDLDVGINITHTNVFDLQIFLRSPAGARVCLNAYDAIGGFFKGANYVQTVFDDEAEVPVELGEAPFTGRFKPVEPYKLSQFDGQDAYGLWRLQVYDAFYADTGTLDSFELMVANPEPATALLVMVGVCLMLWQGRRQAR